MHEFFDNESSHQLSMPHSKSCVVEKKITQMFVCFLLCHKQKFEKEKNSPRKKERKPRKYHAAAKQLLRTSRSFDMYEKQNIVTIVKVKFNHIFISICYCCCY